MDLSKMSNLDLIENHKYIIAKLIKSGLSLEKLLEHPDVQLLSNKMTEFKQDQISRLYNQHFIFYWAFQGDLNINVLIKSIESLPEDINESSTYTLLGESKIDGKIVLSPILKQLETLVHEKHLSIYYILQGKGRWAEYGPTPKTRLISALKELKNIWENKQKVLYTEWDLTYPEMKGSC